jgi:glycosyltransferase involved in cell wall biosynthesis
VPQERLFRGAFPVDIARFRRAVQGQTAQQRSAERARFGLAADAIVALFVGKFIGIKRPLDLVDALGRLQGTQPPVQALLIGSGELESAITTRIRELGLVERVRLAGFVNQAEMPRVLHAGDVLVMPSAVDPHPLVVTESMAVGNAIVASDRVGCVGPTDAARPGVNALVYPCGDVGALAEAIRTLAQDSALRQLMAEASIDLAWSQDTSACVRGVLQAIRALGLGART